MTDDVLINKRNVKAWAWWGMIWITVFPLVGALVSIKFHHPGFLDSLPWFTFGRLRPVHVNGVIFGAFSTLFIALLYYAVPRLCGRRLYKEEWGIPLLWLWNLFLITGTVSLMLGYNLGLEAAEFEWPVNLLRFVALAAITIQVLGTVLQRREPRFYVALWYMVAAFIWTVFNLVLGNVVLPYSDITGVNSAAMHGLYIHYIVGLWLTPAGLAVIYYFLPLSARQSLFSHKLSLLGFWSLAFFYPFVGTHHYLFSPIPYWTQTISIVTSVLLIIPVWAVTINFFGTMRQRWGTVMGGNRAEHYAAKFLILGAVYYLLGCFQGSMEALRRMQELTHFNDFVIAHSHLTVFGAMVAWVVGGLYYIWPRITGRDLYSPKLASWHLWLTIAGFSVMALGLTAQGFIQGSMLDHGANFTDTVEEMKPWWVTRTIGGLAMDVALILMVFNLFKSAKQGPALAEDEMAEMAEQELPRQTIPKPNWLETPSTVMVAAGMVFFFLAVSIQGIVPLVTTQSQAANVEGVITQTKLEVPPYSPEEQRGREVYIREGCWYCHSQYIRPVTGEDFRWGPVSQAGEYSHDQPHLFSTRRIGPDLTRVGRKYADGWHEAHHWNPRHVVPQSIMPRFPWLYDQPSEGPPQLNEDGRALVAYLQRLGTHIGDWREVFIPGRLTEGLQVQSASNIRKDLLPLGQEVYERRCMGCHGAEGDGKGPSAQFLDPRPRDFTKGIFKFHSTPGQDSLPTDSDLFITVTHGLWGTAMPPWHTLPDRSRLAVIQYIKTFSDRWQKEKVKAPLQVPPEPKLTLTSIENGKTVFQTRCAICHGTEGKGDGPLAGSAEDAWGYMIQPADFTLPAGAPGGVKRGHHSSHLFITIMNGVGGDPMPAFADQLDTQQVWDVVHFIQSLYVESSIERLAKQGLAKDEKEQARRKLWEAVSRAAEEGRMKSAVIQVANTAEGNHHEQKSG